MSETPTLDLNQAVDLSALMYKKAEEKAKQLPKPSGYRILCAIPEAEKQFEESEIGLMKADETMRKPCRSYWTHRKTATNSMKRR